MNLTPLGSNQTQIEIMKDGHYMQVLFSYQTPVAAFDRNTNEAFRTSKFWSQTTTKHINKWLKQQDSVTVLDQAYFDKLVK